MSIFSPLDETSPIILTVPGLGGSGPSHWQTLWEQSRPDTHRVELGMWNSPHRNTWVTKLDQAIRQAQAPVVLAAHSLGCLAVAWWANWPVSRSAGPSRAPCWSPRPMSTGTMCGLARGLPANTCKTPSLPLDRGCEQRRSVDRPEKARALAGGWGSFFVDAGPQGHLNAASGIGWWEEGQELLDRVLDAASDRTGKVRSANDARSLLAVSATEAAQAHYYGQHASIRFRQARL